jgi:hypothetical protein
MVKALLAAACCMAVAACAMGGKAKSAAPESTAASPMPASPREQLEQLEAQIEASRTELQLEAPTEPQIQSAPAQPMGVVPATDDPTCRPAKTETCTTSCTLSDSICSNADKICNIAKDLGDAWASGKCAKANSTCEASRAKCCGCQ